MTRTLWNNVCLQRALIWAMVALFAWSLKAHQPVAEKPSLLLTRQRSKRLVRERERQTERWVNFENRVKTVPDSSERGFELALYYMMTQDQGVAKEAVLWAKSHGCERRQLALIQDALPESEYAPGPTQACRQAQGQGGPLARMRDSTFENLSKAGFKVDAPQFLSALQATSLNDSSELYAAAEILLAIEGDGSRSIREQQAPFFGSLPVQFLLSLKPAEVEHPDWQTHIAALALIALDPNSDSSQFLQGWAIEDRQMIHEGPGVAYEFLWADPYLPGVGYQNLDPWFYDEGSARLLARSDWTMTACSIRISAGSVAALQCPAGWQARRENFGKLQLIPMTEPCVQLPPRANNSSAFLWKLPPNGRVKTSENGKTQVLQADRAGLWRVPSNVAGKVCSVR